MNFYVNIAMSDIVMNQGFKIRIMQREIVQQRSISNSHIIGFFLQSLDGSGRLGLVGALQTFPIERNHELFVCFDGYASMRMHSL